MTLPAARMLVTGTRENSEAIRESVHHRLDEVVNDHRYIFPVGRAIVVVHGQCPKGGVDLYAEQWALSRGYAPERHPADWGRYGKRAGMIRNTDMVVAGADICVGFPGPGSRGTWDCLRQSVDANILTRVFPITSYVLPW